MSNFCDHEWLFNRDYDEQARTESYTCRKCSMSVRINLEAENLSEFGGREVYVCDYCQFESFDTKAIFEHRHTHDKEENQRYAMLAEDEPEEY